MSNKKKVSFIVMVVFLVSIGCFFNFYSIERDLQKIEATAQEYKVEAVPELTLTNEEKPLSVYTNEKVEKTVSFLVTDKIKKPFTGIDFGNGVKYFPFTGVTFGEKLSEFIESNTNLEVVTIAGDIKKQADYSYAWGETIGYFVIFREKK